MTGQTALALAELRHAVEQDKAYQLLVFSGESWVRRFTARLAADSADVRGLFQWAADLGSSLGALSALYGADVRLNGREAVLVCSVTAEAATARSWPHQGRTCWYPQTELRAGTDEAWNLLRLAVACPGEGWPAAVACLLGERIHPAILQWDQTKR